MGAQRYEMGAQKYEMGALRYEEARKKYQTTGMSGICANLDGTGSLAATFDQATKAGISMQNTRKTNPIGLPSRVFFNEVFSFCIYPFIVARRGRKITSTMNKNV